MRIAGIWRAFSLAVAALKIVPVAAIESQALGIVELLPAQVRQVFACGAWSESGVSGYYRIVLAGVSDGAGTEVYIQRIGVADGSSPGPKLVDTTPVRELNNDHAQYQVSSARCIGAGARSSVELMRFSKERRRRSQHFGTGRSIPGHRCSEAWERHVNCQASALS